MKRLITSIVAILLFQCAVYAQSELSTADKAFKQYDYYTAYEYYERVFKSSVIEIKNDKKRMETRFKFAEAARFTYNFRKAEECYKIVMDSEFRDEFPTVGYYYAYTLKHNGKYQEASIAFNEYVGNPNGDPELKLYAQQEIGACALSQELMDDFDKTIKITALDAINTKYSDFAPHEVDGQLYYSSLKFERQRRVRTSKNDVAENFLIGKLMVAPERGKKAGKIVAPLSEKYVNCGNSTASADGSYMIYTKCALIDLNTIQCKLFIAYWDEETAKWSEPIELPKNINEAKSTTTHPAIAVVKGQPTLFFVSDRKGGQGKLDIWSAPILNAENNEFGDPKNLGSTINTREDDITPHFNYEQQTLYFSSKWHQGLGGFDIFRSQPKGDDWTTVENIGVPFNSAANDIYFNQTPNDSLGNQSGYFASNRPGSKILMGESCCNDIYAFTIPVPPPPVVVIDTPPTDIVEVPPTIDTPTVAVTDPPVPVIDTPTPPTVVIADPVLPPDMKEDIPIVNINNTDETLLELNEVLPISLYFHNDRPNPKSYETTTTLTYEETYREYIDLREEYEDEYSGQFSGTEKTVASDKINGFFDNYVSREFSRMQECFNLILALLERGEKIEIQLRGFTSARAKSSYNKVLASRRIASVRNEMEQYKDGAFIEYIDNGQFIISELPLGESEEAEKEEGDDKVNSIYGVEAAKSRRVEIVGVKQIDK